MICIWLPGFNDYQPFIISHEICWSSCPCHLWYCQQHGHALQELQLMFPTEFPTIFLFRGKCPHGRLAKCPSMWKMCLGWWRFHVEGFCYTFFQCSAFPFEFLPAEPKTPKMFQRYPTFMFWLSLQFPCQTPNVLSRILDIVRDEEIWLDGFEKIDSPMVKTRRIAYADGIDWFWLGETVWLKDGRKRIAATLALGGSPVVVELFNFCECECKMQKCSQPASKQSNVLRLHGPAGISAQRAYPGISFLHLTAFLPKQSKSNDFHRPCLICLRPGWSFWRLRRRCWQCSHARCYLEQISVLKIS